MKIRCRKSKKRYLGKKNVYEYDALSIGIPSKYSKDVEPFLCKDLAMTLKIEKNRIIMVLEPRENVSADRKPLGKNV
jgi:hypothetical protein